MNLSQSILKSLTRKDFLKESDDEQFLRDNGPIEDEYSRPVDKPQEVEVQQLEEYVDPRPNETYIRNLIDEDQASESEVLDAILRWLPDDELGRIIKDINRESDDGERD